MVPKCGGLIDCVFSPSVASPGKALSWSSWATDQSVRDLATRGMTERFPSFAIQRSQEAPFGVEQAVAMRAAGADYLRMLSRVAPWLLVPGGLIAVVGLVLIPLPGPGLSVVVLGVPVFVVGLVLRQVRRHDR
jgi:hypothetical protein